MCGECMTIVICRIFFAQTQGQDSKIILANAKLAFSSFLHTSTRHPFVTIYNCLPHIFTVIITECKQR